MRAMKNMASVLGLLILACLAHSVLAQDSSCTAGGKEYLTGTTVCMGGFEQQCVKGSWSNQQRFCSEDSRFDVIREPNVAVPQVGGPKQPAVPPADKPADVVVPQE